MKFLAKKAGVGSTNDGLAVLPENLCRVSKLEGKIKKREEKGGGENRKER